jgi:hypothetical protein
MLVSAKPAAVFCGSMHLKELTTYHLRPTSTTLSFAEDSKDSILYEHTASPAQLFSEDSRERALWAPRWIRDVGGEAVQDAPLRWSKRSLAPAHQCTRHKPGGKQEPGGTEGQGRRRHTTTGVRKHLGILWNRCH